MMGMAVISSCIYTCFTQQNKYQLDKVASGACIPQTSATAFSFLKCVKYMYVALTHV